MERRGEDSQKHWFFYGECERNHTIELGKTTWDGCGEFMPDESTPDSLLCVACKCHRNYHRKTLYIESDDEGDDNQQRAPEAPPMEMQPVTVPSYVPVAVEEPAVELAVEPVAVDAGVELQELDGRRKPRTTFTDVQRERMRLFAEELDWKMVRHRNVEIINFCNEIGVSRQSFKFWMHNHKSTSSSSSMLASIARAGTSTAGAGRGNIGSSSGFRN